MSVTAKVKPYCCSNKFACAVILLLSFGLFLFTIVIIVLTCRFKLAKKKGKEANGDEDYGKDGHQQLEVVLVDKTDIMSPEAQKFKSSTAK